MFSKNNKVRDKNAHKDNSLLRHAMSQVLNLLKQENYVVTSSDDMIRLPAMYTYLKVIKIKKKIDIYFTIVIIFFNQETLTYVVL